MKRLVLAGERRQEDLRLPWTERRCRARAGTGASIARRAAARRSGACPTGCGPRARGSGAPRLEALGEAAEVRRRAPGKRAVARTATGPRALARARAPRLAPATGLPPAPEDILQPVARRLVLEDRARLLGDHAARLGRRQPAVVDVGDHRVLVAHVGPAAVLGRGGADLVVADAVGQVGREAARGARVAARPLADQHDDDLGAERLGDRLGDLDAAVGDEDRVADRDVARPPGRRAGPAAGRAPRGARPRR